MINKGVFKKKAADTLFPIHFLGYGCKINMPVLRAALEKNKTLVGVKAKRGYNDLPCLRNISIKSGHPRRETGFCIANFAFFAPCLNRLTDYVHFAILLEWVNRGQYRIKWNLKDIFMYKTMAIVCILFHAGVVKAIEPAVDFDGKTKGLKSIVTHLQNVVESSVDITSKDTRPQSVPELPDQLGFILQERVPTGEWRTIQPEVDKDSYYIRLPDGAQMNWGLTCSGGSAGGKWSVDVLFQNSPEAGGHSHSSNVPPLTHTPEGAPVPPAHFRIDNIPTGQTPAYVSFTAPYFATRVIATANFSGACQGKLILTVDFKVRDLFPMGNGIGYVLAYGSGSHYQIHNVHELFEPKLRNIGRTWKQTCPNSAPLPYERMSLPWGGLFDLNDNWSMPAWSHDWGTTADVSKVGVNKGNRKKLIEMICRYLSVDTEIYSEKDPSHYHIALRGVPNKTLDEASVRGIGMQACCPTGTAGIPQECIDLAPGFNETLPVESNCP